MAVNIRKEKYQTTMLLRPEEKVNQKIIEVLKTIFWRKPELSEPALKFLELIKRKNGIEDSYWGEFCKKEKIQRSQYDSIIKKLRGAGLIYKRDTTWKLSNSFERYLEVIIKITINWREEK